jgi:hypothetical protein
MKRMSFPVKAFQVRTRTSGDSIGVREAQPSSVSILRLERLSMMMTSCPTSARYNAVGHPQNPSPPRTSTFFLGVVKGVEAAA